MSIEEEEEKFMQELARRSQLLLEDLNEKEVEMIQDQVDEQMENRQELVQSYCLRSKKYLDLGSCQIDDFDSLTIGIFLNEVHSNIEVINLASNKLTDEGLLNMLIGMQFHSNLRELYLGNNQFTIGTAIEGLSTILPCLKNLRILGLGNDQAKFNNLIKKNTKKLIGGLNIDDEDLIKILYGISEIDSLKNIQLHKNKISDEGLVCFISMMLLGFGNEIETVYLGQNDEITEEGIVKLFECLQVNQTLKCLHLNDIIMTDKSLSSINISLMSNKHLEELNLGNCGIDDEGFKLIQDCIKNNNKLQYLHLWNNHLTFESAEIIHDILENYNSILKGITLYNNDIINRDLLNDIQALTQQNVYFEQTVNNEEFYDKKIEEMKKSYAKHVAAQKEKSKETLLQGKMKGLKNVPYQQNNGQSMANKSNVSQTSATSTSSTQINSTSKLSTQSVASSKQATTSSTLKRPQSGVSTQKPPVSTTANTNSSRTGTIPKHQASQSMTTSKTTSNSNTKIPSTPQKSEVKSTSSLKGQTQTQLSKSSSKENSKKSLPPPTKSTQQSQQKKKIEESDDEDIEYVSLSSNINGSIIKRDYEFEEDNEDEENNQSPQELKQKTINDQKQSSKSLNSKLNQKQVEKQEPTNNVKKQDDKDIEFDEEWLDDDEEDEKELQLLEKQLEDDEEIISKERNTRLEFVDEFYNEEESNKEFKKYQKYEKNILQYDPKDPNTLKWQGFFEDKDTGLLKSKYS